MTAPRLAGANQLRDAYRRVIDRVGEAAVRSGRRPQDVHVIAVTKTASPDMIRTLVEMGHRDLGENRVQQLIQRHAQLDEFISRRRTMGSDESLPDVRWHMIGHLQRNKVKQVVPLVRLIHSVDSLRLAEELHALGAKTDPQANHPTEVLLQVNISGEAEKFGLAPPAVAHMAEQIDSMIHLKLRGLMTMAPYVDDPEAVRPIFARTAELFADIKKTGKAGPDFNILSMGMSGDYEVAIEEGANLVRIGRAIFGDGE